MQEGGMTEAFRSFNDMTMVCVPCYLESKQRYTIPGT